MSHIMINLPGSTNPEIRVGFPVSSDQIKIIPHWSTQLLEFLLIMDIVKLTTNISYLTQEK